jgi:KUP system potassium uptake protein
VLAFVGARRLWGWALVPALFVFGFFACIDLAFFGANIIKVAEGGWFPLAAGAGIFTLMSTWQRGRQILGQRRPSSRRALKT